MEKIIWEVSGVITNDNELIDLGKNPRGGIAIDKDGNALYAISYDGVVRVDAKNIDIVIERSEDGREFQLPLAEWLENIEEV